MINTEPRSINTGTRSLVLMVACAAVGLGALVLAQFNTFNAPVWLSSEFTEDTVFYGRLAAVVLALLAWHLWPRRSWAALVVLGALCAVPTHLFLLASEDFGPWMLPPYAVVRSIAEPLLGVGLLCLATVVWRAGRHRVGAVLIGATAVTPLVAYLIVGMVTLGVDRSLQSGEEAASLLLEDHDVSAFVPVLGLLFIAATVALAIAAAANVPRPVELERRPQWRVTVAGAVAGVAVVVFRLWPGPDLFEPAASEEQFEQHILAVGLVVLGVGLLAGLVAGGRVLVSGAAGGLLLGAMSAVAEFAMAATRDLPVGMPVIVTIVALVAGVGLALSRARLWVGVIAVGVVIAGLAVLWLVFSADDPIFGVGVIRVLAPLLLVVVVIAAVALFASFGSVLARAGAAPAAFAGVAAAVSAGIGAIITYFTYFTNDSGYVTTSGTVLPVIVFLACAAGLAILAHHRWSRTPPRPANDPDEHEPADQLT